MEKLVNARQNMIKGQIMPIGVNDLQILQLFANTNREDFIDDKFKDVAYCDTHLPLSDQRYALSPVLLAKMISFLSIDKESNVMDIFSGTGYSTAIISKLCKKVISIETDQELSSKANKLLKSSGIDNVILLNELIHNCVDQDESFDAILINGMIDKDPEQLYGLLADKGEIIYIRKGRKTIGSINIVKKNGDNFEITEKGYCDAPFLQDF